MRLFYPRRIELGLLQFIFSQKTTLNKGYRIFDSLPVTDHKLSDILAREVLADRKLGI